MEQNIALVETARVSKSRSLRMSLPKRIAEKLKIGPDDIVGFYINENNEVIIKKLS